MAYGRQGRANRRRAKLALAKTIGRRLKRRIRIAGKLRKKRK